MGETKDTFTAVHYSQFGVGYGRKQPEHHGRNLPGNAVRRLLNHADGR